VLLREGRARNVIENRRVSEDVVDKKVDGA